MMLSNWHAGRSRCLARQLHNSASSSAPARTKAARSKILGVSDAQRASSSSVVGQQKTAAAATAGSLRSTISAGMPAGAAVPTNAHLLQPARGSSSMATGEGKQQTSKVKAPPRSSIAAGSTLRLKLPAAAAACSNQPPKAAARGYAQTRAPKADTWLDSPRSSVSEQSHGTPLTLDPAAARSNGHTRMLNGHRLITDKQTMAQAPLSKPKQSRLASGAATDMKAPSSVRKTFRFFHTSECQRGPVRPADVWKADATLQTS